MKQNKAIFYTILIVEILTVVLASAGIIEREAVLIMTGLMIFYFIFSKIEDSLVLFIISIPLFAALPIAEFDSMANWRILLTVLFLVWLSKKISFKTKLDKVKTVIKAVLLIKGFKKSKLAILTALFLFISFLSLLVVTDLFIGIKKILFLINIFLLFFIVKDLVKDKKEQLRIIKSGAVAGIIALVIGYSQVLFVLLKPLYTFWQWWARNVISVFYGNNLSELLTTSNTWFSYYPDSPPTLRMFSVFPDSHSFALFIIISLIFFIYLLFCKNKNLWAVIILSLLTLVFSGSRGIWVSAMVPFGIILLFYIYGYFKNKKYSNLIHSNKNFIRLFTVFFLVFLFAFPISSFVLSQSYQGTDVDASLAFKRAKTIIDLEELSVKNRMGIWKASFNSILKRPVLGVGIGNYPIILNEDISAAKKGASAHNLYLDIASEIGLIGLLVLLLIFWQILKKSWKTNWIFAFFIVWIFVYSLFDVVLLNDKVLLLFIVMLGLLYSQNDKKISSFN